ncbi:MAG: 50S ribosomal protein L9 [Bacteroidetes bacterium GWF2_38_335]|nr:MAG: 50S ribosomal protein L9 [Bacteroidetes bacterium GWF2_38_335]OFY77566.1 MAG: 50S ribosomal protein L9 [Bacteroidetes bacterium RIFOXYA12_FULL_38_20]HBS87134.1 50S ribosomal protein L9 [Bacteroidales bacterium]
MEIILKQDMPGLGHKDELVKVKEGYGRNYLIPNGMATLATESKKKIHAENMRQRAHKEEKIRNEAKELAKKLEGTKVKIGAKTSTTGKIFGSVTTIQIAEKIKEVYGFEVDRKNISIKGDSIKEVGTFNAHVKLYKSEVAVDIEFEVYSE